MEDMSATLLELTVISEEKETTVPLTYQLYLEDRGLRVSFSQNLVEFTPLDYLSQCKITH